MSTVDLLGIQGIRSFGCEAADFQRVRFFKPLTLILGPNGTGKTTIIECLKYAATGDMPPGTKGPGGAAFVHDPKLAKESEIKAQVKMMIRDITGTTCTVQRSMTARVKDGKGKKVEMKTLDGVLTRLTPNGDKQSITSRCADLNREMIGALGVSKAVLDNVIFCHQEDSNWPLSEGKALKEKFDAIFASTRYTKVLDEIKKLKQSQDLEIREGKKEMDYLKQHKSKAEELERDLEDLQVKLTASIDSVNNINEELKPVKEQLITIGTRQNDIFKLDTEKQKLVSEQSYLEKSIEDLMLKIKEEFQGTTAELKKTIQDFTSQLEEKQEELDQQEQEQNKIKSEIEKLMKEKSTLMMEKGKLEKEAEIQETNIKRRNKKIYEVAKAYTFEGLEEDVEINDAKYRLFFELIKDKLSSMMDEGRKKKAEFEETENQLQVKVDKLRETKTKLEHGEKIKNETIEKNTKEIKEINQKLSQMAASEDKLAGLGLDLKRAENELHAIENSLNPDDIKKEILDLDRQKKQLDATLNELSTELNKITKQSGIQTQLDMLIANQQEKESTIERLRNEHKDSIESVLGHIPMDNLRESVSDYISNQTDNVRKCNAVLSECKAQLSKKQAEKNAATDQLRQKEDDLRASKDKIQDICESQDLDEEFNEVQRNLTQAQEEKGSLLGADHMIKKYIRNLEKNNPCCPLCQRGFQQAQEVRELILKLQEQLRKVPISLRKAEEDMEKYQKKYDDIMQLRPIQENADKIQDIEIPNLKEKIKKLDEDIKHIKENLQTKEDEFSMLEDSLQTAKSFEPDVIDMDRRRGEVRELQRKIEAQRALLIGGVSGRTTDVVMQQREEKQLELETINRTLDLRRDKLSEYQEQTQKMRNKVHTLQAEKLSIEGNLQQKIKFEERRATLTSENKNFQRDIDEARTQLKPIENQIKKLIEEKADVSKEKEMMMEKAKADVDIVKKNGTDVRNLNTEIKSYNDSGKSEKLKSCMKKEEQLESFQKKLEERLDNVTAKVKQLHNDISNQQMRERELQDNLQLRNNQEELNKLGAKIEELKGKLVGFDMRNLEQERQKLILKERELTQKQSNAFGRQQGFKDQIKAVTKDLGSDMYKDAHQKYKSKIIEIKTTEIVNADLQKYYGALDKAIMMYHKSKMEEINIIIRELWKNVYRGNDIETIEIQSEADDGPATSTIKARRSYNYRVVMIKNGIPIDMRGRCSAGQKVLASLIIRLALAETFCVNCGILALDEPTTNLDRANIESLAVALVEVIKERHSLRHFQLVVITHDADFVELLGRSDYVDEYVQVSKNSEGLSRLTVRKVEDLHSS
ncbi:DNA repair protein RAD50-like [Physella acuta]|uniref:DNA repair protein RAD50-like n=1 Tax=Physella acuta TaxID=109671 RepID=UPI0027DDE6B2|nr:DNA repair protein RAD50-like [Physella acuta]XP_059141795.1 DNA repair protein RAD50-like [Physella acuta]